MSESDDAVLTIGHSNHVLDVLLALLRQHRVTALADVRSAPYSRFNPQFNREPFAGFLEANGIRYVYLGNELGGRSDNPACYEDGRIRYDRVAKTESFKTGLARVVRGAATHRIALMCAEKEPLHCHRTLLVARALDARGVGVAHIHADGRLEPHRETMDRLLDTLNLPRDGDLSGTREEQIAIAIARQEKRVAHADGRQAVRAGKHSEHGESPSVRLGKQPEHGKPRSARPRKQSEHGKPPSTGTERQPEHDTPQSPRTGKQRT